MNASKEMIKKIRFIIDNVSFKNQDNKIEVIDGKIKIPGSGYKLSGNEFKKAFQIYLGEDPNLSLGDIKITKTVGIFRRTREEPSSPAKTRSQSKKEVGKGIGDGIKKILNRTMDHAENGNFEIAHNLFHSVKDVAPKHVIAKVRKYLNHIRDNHHI